MEIIFKLIIDFPAIKFADLLDNGQPQTTSTMICWQFGKPFEQQIFIQFFCPGIGNFEDRMGQFDLNNTIDGSVPDRI